MAQFKGNRLRALAAAGVLTVAGVAGTVVTVANAQQPTPTPTPSAAAQQRQQRMDEYLERLARNLGVTSGRLRDALRQTALQDVDAALARGDITAQQAQQARDRINAGQVGFGPFGGRGPGHDRGPGGRGFGIAHDQLAQFLGITPEQLRTELNGRSLAQVAQAHGRSRDQLIQFIISSVQQRLAVEVQAGRLTQQQADQRVADLRGRVDEMVDRVHQPGQRPQPSGTPRSQ